MIQDAKEVDMTDDMKKGGKNYEWRLIYKPVWPGMFGKSDKKFQKSPF
jgi:hypothetical protein